MDGSAYRAARLHDTRDAGSARIAFPRSFLSTVGLRMTTDFGGHGFDPTLRDIFSYEKDVDSVRITSFESVPFLLAEFLKGLQRCTEAQTARMPSVAVKEWFVEDSDRSPTQAVACTVRPTESTTPPRSDLTRKGRDPPGAA